MIHFRKEKIPCRAAGSGERGLPYRAVPVPEELLEYEYRIPSLMPVCQVQGILARKLEEYLARRETLRSSKRDPANKRF